MYRMADLNGADRQPLFKLWRQTFMDEDRFIASALDVFAGQGNVYVAEVDNKVVAMLNSIPCNMGGNNQGEYFYALATEPEYQRRGLMGGLMSWAEQRAAERGSTFAALIPATEQLYGYYNKHGYTAECKLRRVEQQLDQLQAPAANAAFDTAVTLETLTGLRRRWLGADTVMFSGIRNKLALEDVYLDNGRVAQCGEAYAVYRLTGSAIQVAELGAADECAAEGLLRQLLQARNASKAEVTVPAASPVFAGKGKTIPAALAKPLGPGAMQAGFYLRFGLDDPFAAFDMWKDASA